MWAGGPIIKDRLFFCGAYEHQEAGQAQDDGPAGAGYANEIPGIPVEAFNEISDVLSSVYGIETVPLVRMRPFSNDRYFGRLDWQVNSDHRVQPTYHRLDEGLTSPVALSSSTNSPRVTGLTTFFLLSNK